MKSNHLTDQEIQEFLFGKSTISKDTNDHINSCKECESKIANYKTITESIKAVSNPSFDFDLSGMVMEKLITKKQRTKLSWHLIFSFVLGLISFAIIIVCINFIFAKTNLLEYIKNGIDSFTVIIFSVSLMIGIVHAIEILYRHKKLINIINAK
ncbi:MAG: hypothetical protein AB1521_17645 [Bacteroidota bacterium]